VVATIPVGPGPVGAAVTPNGAFVYVANDSGSPVPPTWTVSVIATATNTVVATIPVDQFPVGVAITPDGASAYVSNNGVRSVSVIATATNTVTTTVTTTDCPDGIAITPAVPSHPCPLGQGLWKNHPGAWPVTSLTLGSQTYTQAELLALFDTPPGGDASLILAHQLIAAKLNIANGSDPTPISATITDADHLLSGFKGKLPYHVRPSSATGQAMVNDADVLDSYNSGDLTPNCQP
jgi:YVTN family beta-propeller protein